MFTADYLDKKYKDTFNSIYMNMKNKKETDKNYTIKDLENLIESLYANEGNNWTGRSELKDTIHSATISACQTLFAEWSEEKK